MNFISAQKHNIKSDKSEQKIVKIPYIQICFLTDHNNKLLHSS